MKMLLKTKDFDIFGEPFVFTTNKNQYFKSILKLYANS